MSDSIYYYLSYIIFFSLSIIFSVLINGLFLKFARTLGIRQKEKQDIIRWASTSKPSIGGFSLYIIFLIAISIYSILGFSGAQLFNRQLVGILLSFSFGFLVGLADDAYNTNPLLKFIGQALCGVILIFSGIVIHLTGIYSVDVFITMIWVIGIMNSVNMLDNMDGITASISVTILFACLFTLAFENTFFSIYTFICIGITGALFGFLFYNIHPSKMYMGDTGSQFLGVALSALSILLLWNHRDLNGPAFQFKQLLAPLMAFTVPVIDTATVFIRRIARGQSPFIGGKDHTTHHLAYLGFNDRTVMYIIATVSLFSATLCSVTILFFDDINGTMTFILLTWFVLLFLFVQYIYNLGKKKHEEQMAIDSEKETANEMA